MQLARHLEKGTIEVFVPKKKVGSESRQSIVKRGGARRGRSLSMPRPLPKDLQNELKPNFKRTKAPPAVPISKYVPIFVSILLMDVHRQTVRNNTLARFGTNFFFRNDRDFHLPQLSPVRGRVVKRPIACSKALSQTNSQILSDLKMNKFSACYGENGACNRFCTAEPSTCSKNH